MTVLYYYIMYSTFITVLLLLYMNQMHAAWFLPAGGSLTVKLSTADFANHEEDGNLNINLTVTIAGITPGTNQLEFSFEALTQAQYDTRLSSPDNSFQCSPLSPQGNDVAEGERSQL